MSLSILPSASMFLMFHSMQRSAFCNLQILIIIQYLFSHIFLGTKSSKPVDVPGSSPYLVIDADGDSGFTASVESKF